MGAKTQELIDVLESLAVLLEEDGETHWKASMVNACDLLMASDYAGIEHLLRAYGGMGSFNALTLGQTSENGVFRWKSGYEKMNKRLDALRNKAWELADWIKRHHEVE
jgi:hypothetical protein